jgi:hypothetical protein
VSHIRHMRTGELQQVSAKRGPACGTTFWIVLFLEPRHGKLGQVLQQVVQMLRVERWELDVLAQMRRHPNQS